MKKLLIFLSSLLFACSSDCLQCHPKLKPLENNPTNRYYKEHHFLKSCTKCHPNHTEKGMDKCGADCFDCHSREKIINTPVPAHKRLKSCVKCHETQKLQDVLHPDGVNPILP